MPAALEATCNDSAPRTAPSVTLELREASQGNAGRTFDRAADIPKRGLPQILKRLQNVPASRFCASLEGRFSPAPFLFYAPAALTFGAACPVLCGVFFARASAHRFR